MNADEIMQLVSKCCEEAWHMGRRGDHHTLQVSLQNRELNERLKAVRAALQNETPAKWETEITAMLDNMPACGHPNWMEEGTCATCADWRARPAEPATDARDAARYRWLCNGNGYFLEERGIAGHGEEKKAADEAIDAAMRSALSEGEKRA